MEHNFRGPAYTIGIEEELMILDAETLELVNAIERAARQVVVYEANHDLREVVAEIVTATAV